MQQHEISEQQWLEFADGTIDDRSAARIQRHLAECPECRRLATEMLAWHRRIAREAAQLRLSTTLDDRELDRMLETTLERIRKRAPAPLRHPGWTAPEGLVLLRSLLEPFCGAGTARATLAIAVGEVAGRDRAAIHAGNWGLLVSRLSETIGSVCGIAAARLIARAGPFVAIENR